MNKFSYSKVSANAEKKINMQLNGLNVVHIAVGRLYIGANCLSGVLTVLAVYSIKMRLC